MSLFETSLIAFLRHSNAIEGEHSDQAFDDALKAWEFLIKFKDVLTLQRVLGAHRILMSNLNPRIAGKLRTVGVRVGMQACTPAERVKHKLERLLETALTTDDIRQWHIEFEMIHPFLDGNGRTGRHIMNWQRQLAGSPLLVIHTGKEQQEYYQWFYR